MVVMLGAAASESTSAPAGVLTPAAVSRASGWSVPLSFSAATPAPSVTPYSYGHAPETAPADVDPFAPVIVKYVSASAIESSDDSQGGCMRKWAWVKLDRLPKVSGAAAELGSGVHTQHERWLLDGTPYDLTVRAGVLAMATLHLLPAPGVAQIEREVVFQHEGVTLGGKIDAFWIEQAGEHTRPIVLDHKTTGNPAWAKLTKADLLGHPQAPIYATWALDHSAPAPFQYAELRWNYVHTKPKTPKAFQSWHFVDRDEASSSMQRHVMPGARRLIAVIDQANDVRRAGRPFGAAQLPMNTNACGAFGGCPFRSRCGITPEQGVISSMNQTSSFLQRIGVQAAPAASIPPVAPAHSATTQPPPPASSPPVAGVEGYGAAINPPESGTVASAPAEAPASFPSEAPTVGATPAAVAGPGRGKKGTRPAAPPATVPAEASPLAAAVTNVFGSHASFDQSVYVAVISGLYSNPAALAFTDAQIADRARVAAFLAVKGAA